MDLVSKIIITTSCNAEAFIDKISKDLKRLVPKLPNPFDHCRKELNKKFPGENFLYKSIDNFTFNKLYEYSKC